MKEIKIFNLPFDSTLGFDDRCIRLWLGGERVLIKQQSYLLDNHHGQVLVLVVEAELLKISDPYLRPVKHKITTPQTTQDPQSPSKSLTETLSNKSEIEKLLKKKELRKQKRAQYKRDTEAAFIRLDNRGRLLVDLLRSWRTTMAQELAMPVYELGSDLFFCEIAQNRPSTLTHLKALPHCKPRFLKLLGQELLTLLQQFEEGQENVWQKQQSEKKS